MQATSTPRRSARRRGKALIGTLAAAASLAGGVLAAAPATASAAMAEEGVECTSWELFFNECSGLAEEGSEGGDGSSTDSDDVVITDDDDGEVVAGDGASNDDDGDVTISDDDGDEVTPGDDGAPDGETPQQRYERELEAAGKESTQQWLDDQQKAIEKLEGTQVTISDETDGEVFERELREAEIEHNRRVAAAKKEAERRLQEAERRQEQARDNRPGGSDPGASERSAERREQGRKRARKSRNPGRLRLRR